ncbi:MAG: hypothetical protein ACYDGN_07325 [Acidimicrobiales bacterium]
MTSRGNVYNFGDAAWHGSMAGKHLNGPIVGMVGVRLGLMRRAHRRHRWAVRERARLVTRTAQSRGLPASRTTLLGDLGRGIVPSDRHEVPATPVRPRRHPDIRLTFA